ncbi:MAG: hypothetical protein ACOC9S_02980 [Planctomycetota bacterium]
MTKTSTIGMGLLAAVCVFIAMPATPAAGDVPTGNPVAEFYSDGEGYPAWTDSIAWDNVIDMSQYDNGSTEFEKFENARDELHAAGGGVLYYPAGVYDFSEGPFDGPDGRGLMLKSGVVIRGEAPDSPAVAADEGELELPTKFVFGFQEKGGGEVPRDWNMIGITPSGDERLRDVDNVGIAWVNLDGATVFFGPELVWGDTWATAQSWKSRYVKDTWADRKPDGAHPYDGYLGAPGMGNGGGYLGCGSGRMVFGCRLDRAALLNDFETAGRREAPEGFGEEGFHMAKFAGRIAVYGSRIFIANNLLPKSEGNFTYRQTTVETFPRSGNNFAIGDPRRSVVLWDYGRNMGIDVNKDLLGMVRDDGKCPGLFEPGVVVRDNWVFNHGHKGFNVSGKWVTLLNNHNERVYLREPKGRATGPYGFRGWNLTLDGFTESSPGGGGMISDNLSRAFDLGGRCIWIAQNWYNNLGSDPGNDGEGILCQLHGGTHLYSWAATHNTHVRDEGEGGYIGAWAVKVHGWLVAWNDIAGWVGSVNGQDVRDAAYVANKAGGVRTNSDAAITSPPGGTPSVPTNVSAETYEGGAVAVSWTDTANNEIGFRVDRKIDDGGWVTVAYRPPHVEGTEDNPQKWVDFTAPSGRRLRYRVVAVNADDSDAGASDPTEPIVIAQ